MHRLLLLFLKAIAGSPVLQIDSHAGQILQQALLCEPPAAMLPRSWQQAYIERISRILCMLTKAISHKLKLCRGVSATQLAAAPVSLQSVLPARAHQLVGKYVTRMRACWVINDRSSLRQCWQRDVPQDN